MLTVKRSPLSLPDGVRDARPSTFGRTIVGLTHSEGRPGCPGSCLVRVTLFDVNGGDCEAAKEHYVMHDDPFC